MFLNYICVVSEWPVQFLLPGLRVPTQPGKREKSVKLNIALPALEKSLN